MKNRLLVVNYHYIREDFPHSGINGISPKEFESQIDIILKEKFKFIGLTELHDLILSDNKSLNKEKLCLITFDDGLAESFFYGFNYLEQKGIPCVFYVCSDTITRKEVLDVHKLHFIKSKLSDAEIISYISSHEWRNFQKTNFSIVANQYPWDPIETDYLKYFLNFYLDIDSKSKIMKDLFAITGVDEAEYSKTIYISDSDIIKLSGLNALGSHGQKHLALANLEREHQGVELAESKNVLENLTGKIIDSFSYPYGGETSINNSIFEMARNVGYVSGFTMIRGFNSDIDLRLNPLALKRYDTNEVFGGKSALMFQGGLSD